MYQSWPIVKIAINSNSNSLRGLLAIAIPIAIVWRPEVSLAIAIPIAMVPKMVNSNS